MATTNGGLEENQTSRLDSTDNSGTQSEAENSGSCFDNLPPPTSANNVAGGNESEQETKEDNIVNDGAEVNGDRQGEDNDTGASEPKMSKTSDTEEDLNSEVQNNQTNSTEELIVELPPSDKTGESDSKGELKVELPPLEGAVASTSSEQNNVENENGAKSKDLSDSESVYHIKWVNFKNQKVPIITQNENGPCPLLAIMNILLLKKKVTLTQSVEFITANQVMAHLGNCVLENVPREEAATAQSRLNFEQNMQDAMAVMHKLQTGLDVNVRFTGVRDFEYTTECIIFDLLHVSLYHGWLVDPQNQDEVEAVGKCSYNQLVEKIIGDKTSDKPEEVQQALIAEQFLERTASQLTYHGLCELNTQVKDDELAVFFRNNHFTTLYRNKNELFQLVTDQGFLTESNVVWETLGNVEGDCHFVDSEFHTYTKPEPPSVPVDNTNIAVNTDEQIDHDYLVALSLNQEEQFSQEQMGWGQIDPQQAPQMSDLELAKQLQEEERQAAEREAAVAAERQQQQRGPAQAAAGRGGDSSQRRSREEKKSDCCIL